MAIKNTSEWDDIDKLCAAQCVIDYPTLPLYMEALEYKSIDEARVAFEAGKRILKTLRRILTDEGIKQILIASL